MQWFKNLKIRAKLFVSFILVIILTVAVAVIGNYSLSTIGDAYTELLDYPNVRDTLYGEARYELMAIRRLTTAFALYSGDDAAMTEAYTEVLEKADAIRRIFSEIKDNLSQDAAVDQAAADAYFARYDAVIADIDRYIVQVGVLYQDGRYEVFNHAEIADRYAAAADIIADTVTEMETLKAEAMQRLTDGDNESEILQKRMTALSNIVTGAAVLAALGLAFAVSAVISKPIKQMVAVADSVAAGNLNINIDTSMKDETGGLAGAFNNVVVTVNSIISDLSELSREFTVNGDIDYRIDASEYKGAYADMILGINRLISEQVGDTLMILGSLTDISGGSFDIDIRQMPGKKRIVNEQFGMLTGNLKKLNADLTALVGSAADGDLKARADGSKYSGGWARIIADINHLIGEAERPVTEVVSVMRDMSAGNFKTRARGEYKGDFLTIKNAINDTVSNISSYIDEIGAVLGAVAANDLNQAITREYVGQFTEIKDAINNIINKFNRVIIDIYTAADQVAAGSKQISESSMTLAQGASEQASSIEQLNATITAINENTIQNAGSAKEAERLANDSKADAAKGSVNMGNMLVSMDNIKDSSNKISKIIKVIEDIAFQTNLLALNAAVEAARAGDYGKGFAVVAEEVRSLAGRSQEAAKETTQLIEESITKVNDGTKIADITNEALQSIVAGVDKVSEIITGIAGSSREQSDAIGQVVIGVQQITEVVQNNSATSEESASASEELASQADVLKSLVDVFKTRG